MSVAVADASALVALLLGDDDADGAWASRQPEGTSLLAPSLVLYETVDIIRRHDAHRTISTSTAAQAHQDLLDLPIELWPYELLARRARALRTNLTVYDASYVALAQACAAPLITLDRRIARAPGIRCPVRTPA